MSGSMPLATGPSDNEVDGRSHPDKTEEAVPAQRDNPASKYVRVEWNRDGQKIH